MEFPMELSQVCWRPEYWRSRWPPSKYHQNTREVPEGLFDFGFSKMLYHKDTIKIQETSKSTISEVHQRLAREALGHRSSSAAWSAWRSEWGRIVDFGMRGWRSQRRSASGVAGRWLGEVGTRALLEKILSRCDAAGFGELECPTTPDVAKM